MRPVTEKITIDAPVACSDYIATLVLVVRYDRYPTDSDLQELLDKSREAGGPVVAQFTSLRPVSRDILKEF